MSIDLSKVIALSDQRGAWKQIADASGRVLWKLANKVIISFVVDGVTCQAEEGMTWGEWIESDYNTMGVYLDSYGTNIVCIGQNRALKHIENPNNSGKTHYLIIESAIYERNSTAISPPPPI